eukprot:1196203-Prorocentrum_minimum.AAC.1
MPNALPTPCKTGSGRAIGRLTAQSPSGRVSATRKVNQWRTRYCHCCSCLSSASEKTARISGVRVKGTVRSGVWRRLRSIWRSRLRLNTPQPVLNCTGHVITTGPLSCSTSALADDIPTPPLYDFPLVSSADAFATTASSDFSGFPLSCAQLRLVSSKRAKAVRGVSQIGSKALAASKAARASPTRHSFASTDPWLRSNLADPGRRGAARANAPSASKKRSSFA